MFGLVTNAGNVFYACVFLATHFILECYGRHQGLKTLWFGTCFILFFVIMSQVAVHFAGPPLSSSIGSTLPTLSSFSLRVTFASILAYVYAQYVNIATYEWIRRKTSGRHLWMRSNAANILSQLVDSSIFFTIAFFNMPGKFLIQAILVGWLIKIVVVSMGTPFLYINRRLEQKKI